MEHFVQYHNPDVVGTDVTYVADHVIDAPDDHFRYTISGVDGRRFVPPLDLTDEPWFAAFLRFNANFSLGLRRIPGEYRKHLPAAGSAEIR